MNVVRNFLLSFFVLIICFLDSSFCFSATISSVGASSAWSSEPVSITPAAVLVSSIETDTVKEDALTLENDELHGITADVVANILSSISVLGVADGTYYDRILEQYGSNVNANIGSIGENNIYYFNSDYLSNVRQYCHTCSFLYNTLDNKYYTVPSGFGVVDPVNKFYDMSDIIMTDYNALSSDNYCVYQEQRNKNYVTESVVFWYVPFNVPLVMSEPQIVGTDYIYNLYTYMYNGNAYPLGVVDKRVYVPNFPEGSLSSVSDITYIDKQVASYSSMVITAVYSVIAFESLEKFVNFFENVSGMEYYQVFTPKVRYPLYASVETLEGTDIVAFRAAVSAYLSQKISKIPTGSNFVNDFYDLLFETSGKISDALESLREPLTIDNVFYKDNSVKLPEQHESVNESYDIALVKIVAYMAAWVIWLIIIIIFVGIGIFIYNVFYKHIY